MRYLKRFAQLINEQADGVVEHVVSVFGNVDAGGDVVHPGAFLKTLQENGPGGADRIRATWQHDVWEPIGRPLEMEEVRRTDLPAQVLDRAPDASGGLRVVTKISMTTRGRDAYTLLQDEVLREWSIGYYPVKYDWDEDADEPVRNLREVKLIEYALVTLAMNHGAVTDSVKAVVPFQDLPLGDEGAAWDADAAEKRVREWAGGADDPERMDWEKYRSAYVLYDKDEPERLSSYKLLIADVIDGKLTAMPRGIFAAAVVLQGGRSPVQGFDDGDVEGAKGHLGRYYGRMDRTAPWDREQASAVTALVEMIVSKSAPTRPVGLDSFVSDLIRLQAPGAGDAWLGQVEQFAKAWATNAAMLATGKEGRVLSGRNVAIVEEAIQEMQEAITALQALLEAAKPPSEMALTAARAIMRRRLALQLSEINHFMGG
jgi:HK97 family phage prohead protease